MKKGLKKERQWVRVKETDTTSPVVLGRSKEDYVTAHCIIMGTGKKGEDLGHNQPVVGYLTDSATGRQSTLLKQTAGAAWEMY